MSDIDMAIPDGEIEREAVVACAIAMEFVLVRGHHAHTHARLHQRCRTADTVPG